LTNVEVLKIYSFSGIAIIKTKIPLLIAQCGILFLKSKNYLFTVFLSSAPALNFATFLAEILIAFPVCGLRPVLAERLATEKEPKPTSATLSPFLSALVVALMNPSIARPASALEIFASEAIESINSALFILFCLGLNILFVEANIDETLTQRKF
jgi:hypothetical protein